MTGLILNENQLICTKCKQIKPISDFVQTYLRRRWPHKVCKACYYPPLRKGRPPSKKQNRVCLICGKNFKVDLCIVKIGKGNFCSPSCRVIFVGKFSQKDGSIYKDKLGYVWILMRDHPKAYLGCGYVKRAILVAEQKLGRTLIKGELTHHINEIKDDDRPENIIVMLRGQHNTVHRGGKDSRTVHLCEVCNNEFLAYPKEERRFCSKKCKYKGCSKYHVKSNTE